MESLMLFTFSSSSRWTYDLVSKVVELGLYSEFRMGTCELVVSHLQYPDEIMILVVLNVDIL